MQKILATIGLLFAVGLSTYVIASYRPSELNLPNAPMPANSTSLNANGETAANANTSETTTDTTGSTEITLNAETIIQHDSPDDCWLLIQGGVYDVTSSLSSHPGGAEEIISYCGRDATSAFGTKGGRGTSHSDLAVSQLSAYLIGAFGDVIGVTQDATTTGTTVVETLATTIPTEPIATVPAPAAPAPAPVDPTIKLTMVEVAKHSTSGDCWLIINGSVYNVTPYLTVHPGGSAIIVNYCGQDGTTAFVTQDGRGSHSSFASSLLANYRIGTLNETVPEPVTTEPTTPVVSPTPTNGDDENEQEDSEDQDESHEEDQEDEEDD